MFCRLLFLVAAVQVAPAIAFAPLQYRRSASTQLRAVEDLEVKLLSESPKKAATKTTPPLKERKSVSIASASSQSEMSLLKLEMPQYESTTVVSSPTKAKPEKPLPKPKPTPAPKAERPAPAPKVERPKPVPKVKPIAVIEKPKPRPIVVQQVKKPLPPPQKPAASGDFQTLATGGTTAFMFTSVRHTSLVTF
jgi:hypothetical protein